MNKRVRRKLQRVKRKRFTRVEEKEGLFEMGNGDVDLSRCPYYRTGCNFKDIDDLRDPYYTLLEEYVRWSLLP